MIKVFLVEDEPWTLVMLKNLIDWGELGLTISGEAGNGVEAWERIERIRPELVLSDIKMPGMDGLELLKKIKGSGIGSEVIFISGYSEFEYARQGLQYGAFDYLLKPVEEEGLRTTLLRGIKAVRDKSGLNDIEEKQEGYRSADKQIKVMLEYIEQHYMDISLSVLADKFHLAESYISNVIREKTGVNFSEYVLRARMSRAQELLRTTNDSIEEIAHRVGYHDYFYFTRVYKKATGMSPSEYRKKL